MHMNGTARQRRVRRSATFPRWLRSPHLLLWLLAALAGTTAHRAARAAEWFVSPSGKGSGTGSQSNPWDLHTALFSHPGVAAGDTIWLKGGTYRGTFTSTLTGTSGQPIYVRARAGERVVLDGRNSYHTPVLTVQGQYTWYCGFEVTNSDPSRHSQYTGTDPFDLASGDGVKIDESVNRPGLKFIDLVIHDTRQGVSYWKQAVDSQLLGSIVYYNGWDGADDKHGHGVYVQNDTGTKTLESNIVFRNFGVGLHAYGTAAPVHNIAYLRNTVFSNGELAKFPDPWTQNLLLDPTDIALNPEWSENNTWGPWTDGIGHGVSKLGNPSVGAGCQDGIVRGNYLVGATKALQLFNCTSGLQMPPGANPAPEDWNWFLGQYLPEGFTQAQYPNNHYINGKPRLSTDVRITAAERTAPLAVPPSGSLGKRGNITIYRWDGVGSAAVDLGDAGVGNGDRYEVHDAQNFYGPLVASGTYPGSPNTVNLLLASSQPAQPAGLPTPDKTGPEFNAFVVVVPPPCPAPSGLTVTGLSATRNRLSWSPVNGATQYKVYRGNNQCPGGRWLTNPIATVPQPDPLPDPPVVTYEDDPAGALYSYKVTAVTASCESEKSSCADPISALVVSSNAPRCAGTELQLTASDAYPGATYSWAGPNGFSSSVQNPTIANVSAANEGTYTVTQTAGGTTSPAATLVVTVWSSNPPLAPAVIPPRGITVDQTVCCGTFGGVTGATSPEVAAFLAAGGAIDGCDSSPTRLTPQITGVDATNATCFEAGPTTVTFRYQNATGQIGTAAAIVTVRMYGDLNLDNTVDPSDFVIIRDYMNFVAIPGQPQFNAPLTSADVDHDGTVDGNDYVVLRDYLNIITSCLAP